MEYSTVIHDDRITFTDRWGDMVTVEYTSDGRVEVSITDFYVHLEKSQVVDLIKALVAHVAE